MARNIGEPLLDTIATVIHVGDGKFDASTTSGHTVRVEGGAKETGPGPMIWYKKRSFAL